MVSAHQLDRNQARRDNVTVTGVGGGTMVDLNYRFEDGQTGTCRRRSDQKISVHARRYGALTETGEGIPSSPRTGDRHIGRVPETRRWRAGGCG